MPTTIRYRSAMRLLVLLLAMWPGVGRADAVGPPPPSCPPGGRPEACHGDEYCALVGCVGTAECRRGETCTALPLCVGRAACFTSPAPLAVLGDCTACGTGGRCETHFVCVPGASTDAGRPDGGARDAGPDAGSDRRLVRYCGCAAPSREAPPASVLAGLLVLFVALAARR